MQLHHRSTEQLKADVQQLQSALNVPNLPADERDMHTSLIQRLHNELERRASAAQPAQNIRIQSQKQPPLAPSQNHPPSGVGGPPGAAPNQPNSRTIMAGGMSATADPITSSIEIDAATDPHNPRITITWSDGYTIQVDETAATGRFKSTLRDCVSLKCVSEGRLLKMWRWDTPWRCAGFYQALIHFWGKAPSLQDLGIARPADVQRTVFTMITEKAAQAHV